jgi:hypothetical protein
MPGFGLDRHQRQKLQRSDVLVLPLDGAAEQPKALYWNKYGERVKLPADARSIHTYQSRGFSLTRPRRIIPRPTDGVGTEEWDGAAKQVVEGGGFDLEAALTTSPAFQGLASQLNEMTALLKQALGVTEKPAASRRKKAA